MADSECHTIQVQLLQEEYRGLLARHCDLSSRVRSITTDMTSCEKDMIACADYQTVNSEAVSPVPLWQTEAKPIIPADLSKYPVYRIERTDDPSIVCTTNFKPLDALAPQSLGIRLSSLFKGGYLCQSCNQSYLKHRQVLIKGVELKFNRVERSVRQKIGVHSKLSGCGSGGVDLDKKKRFFDSENTLKLLKTELCNVNLQLHEIEEQLKDIVAARLSSEDSALNNCTEEPTARIISELGKDLFESEVRGREVVDSFRRKHGMKFESIRESFLPTPHFEESQQFTFKKPQVITDSYLPSPQFAELVQSDYTLVPNITTSFMPTPEFAESQTATFTVLNQTTSSPAHTEVPNPVAKLTFSNICLEELHPQQSELSPEPQDLHVSLPAHEVREITQEHTTILQSLHACPSHPPLTRQISIEFSSSLLVPLPQQAECNHEKSTENNVTQLPSESELGFA